MSQQTGIHRDTRLNAVKEQIPEIADAMEKHEQFVEGEIKVINANDDKFEPVSKSKKTGAYIWRTQGDGDVRSSHAMRDGKKYNWDSPPEGGHPGEDYGCRCTAAPVEEESEERQIKIEQMFLR